MIDDLIVALRLLRIQIVDRLLPLERALELSDFFLFKSIGDRIKQHEVPSEAWKWTESHTLRRGKSGDCIGKEERRVLERLFARLGESSRQQQDVAIRSSIAEFEEIGKNAKEKLAGNSRLYTTLGVLLGFALAVVFL